MFEAEDSEAVLAHASRTYVRVTAEGVSRSRASQEQVDEDGS